MSGEKILKTEFSGFEGKVSHEKFVVHDTNLLGLTDYSFGLFPTAGFQSSLNRVHLRSTVSWNHNHV